MNSPSDAVPQSVSQDINKITNLEDARCELDLTLSSISRQTPTGNIKDLRALLTYAMAVSSRLDMEHFELSSPEVSNIVDALKRLRSDPSGINLDNIPHSDLASEAAHDQLQAASGNRLPVLICGPVGAGKLTAAYALANSAEDPRVAVFNASSVEPLNAEATLFKEVLAAENGTLIVKHVEQLPLYLQARLLEAYEQQAFKLRTSSNEQDIEGMPNSHSFECRLILTSNINLSDEAHLRAQISPSVLAHSSANLISLPPLKNTQERLALHFRDYLLLAAESLDIKSFSLHSDAYAVLPRHDWKHNITELRIATNALMHIARARNSAALEIYPEDVARVLRLPPIKTWNISRPDALLDEAFPPNQVLDTVRGELAHRDSLELTPPPEDDSRSSKDASPRESLENVRPPEEIVGNSLPPRPVSEDAPAPQTSEETLTKNIVPLEAYSILPKKTQLLLASYVTGNRSRLTRGDMLDASLIQLLIDSELDLSRAAETRGGTTSDLTSEIDSFLTRNGGLVRSNFDEALRNESALRGKNYNLDLSRAFWQNVSLAEGDARLFVDLDASRSQNTLSITPQTPTKNEIPPDQEMARLSDSIELALRMLDAVQNRDSHFLADLGVQKIIRSVRILAFVLAADQHKKEYGLGQAVGEVLGVSSGAVSLARQALQEQLQVVDLNSSMTLYCQTIKPEQLTKIKALPDLNSSFWVNRFHESSRLSKS